MKSFLRFFAERNTLANVLTVMIVFLGISTFSTIKRDNFPSVDMDEMQITTRYAGASPEDVELNVTNKIEEQLEEVDGIEKYTSYSMENISVIKIVIDPDYKDKKKIKTDIRNAVSRVTDLPEEIDEDPMIIEITTDTAIPMIEVGLTGDIPYKELREYTRRFEKKLLNIEGVSSLWKYGYLDREIKIEVSQNAIEEYQIPLHEVVAAIKNRNIRSSGGSFESYTSERNIVTLSQFEEPSEVGNVIVRSLPDGTTVRIHDLANLEDSFEPAKVISRLNGQKAISFRVLKKESADIIRTVEKIKELVERERKLLPEGVGIVYTSDKSRVVKKRLKVVLSNGIMGLVLVMIILGVFLNLRSAFWVGMGIPITLLGTIFFLPMFGAFIDSIALGAMILIIGIVVDDGIVIAETIYRQQEKGKSPVDAAVDGVSSVFLPVSTTILTTFLAFAPMFFMTGMMGKFVFVIPLVVTCALAVSYIEVILAMPAHITAGKPQKKEKTRLMASFETLRKSFSRFVVVAIGRRYLVLAVFAAALVGSFTYAYKYLDFVLFPTQSADEFHVVMELPSGSSLEYTSDAVRSVEKILAALPKDELDSYVTRIGTHLGHNMGENENWSIISVFLTPFSERERNADEIVEAIRKQVSQIKEINKLRFIIEGGGPPVGRPINLRVVGSDDEERKKLASLIVSKLESQKGVKDVDRDDKTGKEQVSVEIDHMRLARFGLTVADVARNIRLAYDGELVTSVRYGDEDVAFRVLLEESTRATPQAITELTIPNKAGRLIQLDEVANFVRQPGPANFYHFDGERSITITGDIAKELTTPLKATKQALKDIDIGKDWPSMRVIVGGEAEESQKSMGSLFVAFTAAALGIYLVLLLLFNSVMQPIIVLLAIPFGFIGVIFAFGIHGQAVGFLAMLGVIGLMGVVVNDSLILVNYVNELQKKKPKESYILLVGKAAGDRFRPILLTSITTVVGLLPIAYGLGGSDPFSAPMALAMGYGILFATPLTLVLLPCLLVMLNDLMTSINRVKSKFLLLGRE